MFELTTEVADILEHMTGESYRRASDGACLVDLVTGRVVEQSAERWKRRTILPAAWHEMRGPICRDLEAYLKGHPRGDNARYVVLTGGERVTIEGLADRIDEVRIRVKRVAEALRDMGVDVLLRATEFPYDPISKTFHVHVNLVILADRHLSKDEWSLYLATLRKANGGFWIRDCGELEKPQEAIKYCLKGEDLEHLMQDIDAFVEFTEVVSGTPKKRGPKLVQPLGAFKAWRRALGDADLRTVWDSESDSVVIVPVRKREAKPEETPLVDPETGEILEPVEQPEEEKEAPRNVLRGLMWSRTATPWVTPHAIVVGYDRQTSLWDMDSDLRQAREIAMQIFEDIHGLKPVQVANITDRVNAAAKACLTAAERPERRAQVRALRRGDITPMAFPAILKEVAEARKKAKAAPAAKPATAGTLRVHNGTSSDAHAALDVVPTRDQSAAWPMLNSLLREFPKAKIDVIKPPYDPPDDWTERERYDLEYEAIVDRLRAEMKSPKEAKLPKRAKLKTDPTDLWATARLGLKGRHAA
ncbi:hypothetical protein KHP60_21175 [Microvirga sp. 3-52]|uniref:hypothetical protein n=1 Tax=Microvirga sp. 3-52 TaxID=2792425 RepID=UPI001BD05E83|nr:hypothetical protein [Microvirga sp. 3-52]MBS7454822.1 hypothetical protein [Microvirga sp. 3-52]